MSAPTTVGDFLALARKSGVLDEKRFASLFPDKEDLPADPQACANALIRAGLLTQFQARQLLSGKFRGFLLGAYKILRPIGQGGMGAVFLAEHTSLKRQVAVKVLTAEKAKDQIGVERFYREARAVAALDHPNIVRLHDVSQGGGVHFLVMEFVEGKDLQSLMGDTGPLHFAQACHYVAQAAAGLQHAHEKGFVHRDIKPANLILAKDGTIKILDMGLARSFLDESDNLTASFGGDSEALGTADFVSPEQALSQQVDERSDIYSLGATLFALITGHPPFKGSTAQILMQHQMAELPRLSKKLKIAVPAALYEVIVQMMAKKKSDRYASASDVIDALSPWLPATPSGNIVHDPLSTQDLQAAGAVANRKRNSKSRHTGVSNSRQKKILLACGLGGALVVGLLIALFGGFGKKDRAQGPETSAPGPGAGPGPGGAPKGGPGNPTAPKITDGSRYALVPLEQYGTATTDRPLFYNMNSERYVFLSWGEREVFGVPFRLAGPQGGQVRNVVLLKSPMGGTMQSAEVPESVTFPVNRAAAAVHFLGGVGAWAWPYKPNNRQADEVLGKVAMIVRLKYKDGQVEEHPLRNGEHIVDWIRPTDAAGSKLAFVDEFGHQVRYLTVVPKRGEVISEIELTKGELVEVSPIVLAVTIEGTETAAGPLTPTRPNPLVDPKNEKPPGVAAETKLKALFLGDAGHHQPAERFKQLQFVFARRGIELTYTDKLDDLNAKTLGQYDALIIYANHTEITAEQEQALLDYVESGKGFVPIHCASYCFLNSPKYVELVGAQFRSHEAGTFRTETVKPDHEIMKGFTSFSSWDETYVHTRHNEKGRTVLEVRAEGELKEPWTWVREQGKGRVFYTAWGHDQRTWGHPGFHNLLERGLRWACGRDPALAGAYFDTPEINKPRKDVKPFEYADANVPFYPPRGGPGGPLKKMQKPLSVEESEKHFVAPVGFEVRVFVTEKELGGKPIAMAWDEQGRLYVAVTVDYPNELQPEGKGRDKILLCEDTDGDGVCDKVTVFADKLSIPTSVLPYAGGLIVHQAPVTLFLKDTDGDGRADLRQELFRGWATGDTHAGPSNLHYGFDGWVYGAVGYAGFNGTVAGQLRAFHQGFYRFKLEKADKAHELKVTKFEFLRSTSNNTWGLGFDESGELFGSTANGCPLVHMPIPNRYFEKVRGLAPTALPSIAADNHIEPITDKIRQVDFHGGFTAAANVAIYTARTYPREYWNRTAFVSEPTGHLTAALTLQPDSASFRAKYGWNLVASDDEWCAPIDAQVGPDGHMWVIDWYAFIVQHNPAPAGFGTGRGNAFESELRDKAHGRIYRVVYTLARPEKPFTLKDATPEQLVEALRHPNMTWRLQAQRLLVERGQTDVVPALVKLIEDRTVDETGLNGGAVHALRTLQGLGAIDLQNGATANAVVAALAHPSAGVRQSALEVLPRQNEWFAKLPERLATDPDAKVRRSCLLALSELPPGEVGGAQLGSCALERGYTEPGMHTALLAAAAAHDRSFLIRMAQLPERPEVLPVVETVARSYAAKATAEDLATVFQELAKDRTATATAVVNGLAAGWPQGKSLALLPAGERAVSQVLGKLPPDARGRLIKLSSMWGGKGLDEQLAALTKAALETLGDPKAGDAERVAAAQQVIEFQPESAGAVASVVAVLTAETPPALAAGIVEALSQSKAKSVGTAVVAKLKDLPPAVRPAALRLVLVKTDSTKALLDAIEAGQLRFDVLALDQRAALAWHSDANVAERAKKLLVQGGGLPNADRQKVIDELKPELAKSGNIENGKKMFLTHCAKCHKHGSEGTALGPDLTSFGVHPREELIIAVLDPSRSVEGNFKLYRVTTKDDRTLLGILGAQTGTSVELIDADAKRHALARADIVSMKETDKSLMPEGFEKVMKPAELADLLEFLGQKGKFVPLPLDKVATAVSTKGMFYDEAAANERLVFPDWKPKIVDEVPFVLVDPRKDTVKNVILLHSENGNIPPKMPKSVSLPFNGKAKAVHILGGVGGWAAPVSAEKTVSLIVRITYDDGKTEDHELKNGVHIADYIRRVDVPGSKFAFAVREQQVRYITVAPKRPDAVVKTIELVKGPDRTAPIVLAVTVETP
jgi:putative membrane-bound dehydrogenase-like protein